MRWPTAGLIFCGLALWGLSGAAPAHATERVWGKAGADAAQMQADLDVCTSESRNVRADAEIPNVISGHPAADAIGFAIAAPIIQARENAKARAAYIPTCMHRRGYRSIALTSSEATERGALSTAEAKSKWTASFYARPEFAQRLSDAFTPALPEFGPEPLAHGALRVAPEALTPAPGPVKLNGILLSGRISHRHTVRLTADLGLPLPGHARLSAGSILHAARFKEEDGVERSYWCGQYRTNLIQSPNLHACIRNDEEGYKVLPSFGAPWMATGIDVNGLINTTERLDFKVEEGTEDLGGPMDLYVVVRRIGPKAIQLEAMASHDKAWETVWVRDFPVDSSGEAVVPFWSRRLTVKAVGRDTVTVAYEPAEVGGWTW